MTVRHRALVDLIGVLVFVYPLCVFIFYQSFDYVSSSWKLHEISRDSGGLPYPAIPLLKSLLLLMPVTVALQGLSMMLNSLQRMRAR